MGFWSFTCAKTHLPILASTSWDDHPLTEIEVRYVEAGERKTVRGVYDGYGRVDGEHRTFELAKSSVADMIEVGTAYILATRFAGDVPEDFAGVSRVDPAQGHFLEEELVAWLVERGSMPSFEAYELVQSDHLPLAYARTLDDEALQAVAAFDAAMLASCKEATGQWISLRYEPGETSGTWLAHDEYNSRKRFPVDVVADDPAVKGLDIARAVMPGLFAKPN